MSSRVPHEGAARTAATSHIGLTHSDEHTTPICTFRCDNLLQRLSGTLNLHGKGWRKVSVGDKRDCMGASKRFARSSDTQCGIARMKAASGVYGPRYAP